MQFFKDTILELSAVQELQKYLNRGVSPISFSGVSHIHKAQLLAALTCDTPGLVVTEDDASARRLCDDINLMLGENRALPFPSKEMALTPVEGLSRSYEHMRLAALSAVQTGQCALLIASGEALLQPTLPPELLEQCTITLHAGEDYDIGTLAKQLTGCGYVRCEKVEGPSQFSVRGALLDVFPVQAAMPLRLEFWGDTLDSIAPFEVASQRRVDQQEQVTIPPAQETLVPSRSCWRRRSKPWQNPSGASVRRSCGYG